MTFDDHHGGDPGSGRHSLILDLEPRAGLPPLVRVRQWAAAALVGLADEHLHAALQVATELVTNAYQHGGGTRQVHLTRNRRPCWVRIEVDDVTTRELTRAGRLEPPRGSGLVIVDDFTSDWGVSAWADGKTVWAQIDCEDNPRVPPCPDRAD